MTAQTKNTKDKNFQWISTLRGFAALLVFTAHLPIPFPHTVSFAIGRTGVALFFLITGYLAVSSRKRRSRKQYLFNRFVRMYPVFWLILIATYVVKILAWNAGFMNYLRDLVLNMTLFNEFLGTDCIIGTSWMMPIQVCFFLMLTVLPTDFFDRDGTDKLRRADVLFLAGCGFTLALSVLRFVTHKNMPTAFGLLILLSLIGLQYRDCGDVRGISKHLIVFAVTFIPSVILSYRSEAVGYIAAYAAGILLFILADRSSVSVEAMNRLGSVGFSFFLAADIPHILLEKVFDPNDSAAKLIVFIIIKFAASLALAYLLTRFVEEPMLKKAKGIESKLK